MATTALQIDFLVAGITNPKNGNVYSGAIVATYEPGTTTPKVVWEDAAKTLPTVAGKSQFNLDSNGQAVVFGDGNYKISVYDATDTGLTTAKFEVDNASYIAGSTSDSIDALYGGDLTAAVAAIGATETNLIIDSASTVITANTVVPDNITLVKTREGLISGAFTLAINGGMAGDLTSQWFASNVTVTGLANIPSVSPEMFGAVRDNVSDDSVATNAAHVAHQHVVMSEGIYRFDNPIVPVSGHTISGSKGTTLYQYGNYLVQQSASDLSDWSFRSMTLDFQSASASRYDCAFSLGAYQRCVIEDLYFVRYDDQTIMERSPNVAAAINGIDNVHRDWVISACAHVDIAIGREGYYYMHQGDGIETVITTDIVWPETFNSSVCVLFESANRVFTQKTLTTDYTVSYDGSDKLIVTMVATPAANERIHIWPAQPRTDGNRRPYSNNLWENIRCNYVFVRGHTAVRWVDAETFRFERLLANADSVRLYITNPYTNRTGQGGDYMRIEDCILSYQATVPTPSTLVAMNFGPGSQFQYGSGIRMDSLWKHSGNNKSIAIVDTNTVAATGTVAVTAGVVTGTGTVFKDEFTLIGAVKDSIIIGGVNYGISTIDSDTQITLTTSPTIGAGAAISRFNLENESSYDISFAANGNGQLSSNAKQLSRYLYGSVSEQIGSATILNGTADITVSHTLSRAPRIGEIMITPHSITSGRTWSISDITTTTFKINLDPVAAADYSFGWSVVLKGLN